MTLATWNYSFVVPKLSSFFKLRRRGMHFWNSFLQKVYTNHEFSVCSEFCSPRVRIYNIHIDVLLRCVFFVLWVWDLFAITGNNLWYFMDFLKTSKAFCTCGICLPLVIFEDVYFCCFHPQVRICFPLDIFVCSTLQVRAWFSVCWFKTFPTLHQVIQLL